MKANLLAAEKSLADAEQIFFAFNASYDPRTGAMGAMESPEGQRLFAVMIAAREHRDALRDEDSREQLGADSREWLRQLPVEWAKKRPMPSALLTLIQQGLAFRSVVGVTITTKGEDVLNRVS